MDTYRQDIEYFWGPDLSGSLQGAGGVGGLVAVSIDGDFYFPGYDNNGNVVGYWDESGTHVAEYSYDAFGNTISSSGSMADVFPNRFSTKYYDAETDLYYYGYRYYSPSLGRWISRDPIGERGGYNVLSFVANSPTCHSDPTGLFRFVSGSLLPVKGDYRGLKIGRKIISTINYLNRKVWKGTKCYDATIEDLVFTPVSTVALNVKKHPDDVYIIAHGGLNVNGTSYPAFVRTSTGETIENFYYWNPNDTVVEGIDVALTGTLTPLSDFGSLKDDNVFACFVGSGVRKQKFRGKVYSKADTFENQYAKLLKKIEGYRFVPKCDCTKRIIIYEGERIGATKKKKTPTSTEEAFRLFPLNPVSNGDF